MSCDIRGLDVSDAAEAAILEIVGSDFEFGWQVLCASCQSGS
jgi:hypothetical protein